MLLINSISHFLVDALCVCTLFSDEGSDLVIPILLYNTLAFSTQCLVGLVADRLKHHAYVTVLGMCLVALGYCLPFPLMIRVCFAGAGNSLFHVGGGAITLESSKGKAWKLGVFVAPGAFGVTLGTNFPEFGMYLLPLIMVSVFLLLFTYSRTPMTLEYIHKWEKGKIPWPAVVLLTCAVAVRAVGGTAVNFPWRVGAGAAMLMTGFVFLGKSAGGFVSDKLGCKKVATFSIPIAALCIAFFSGNIAISLFGQFLLNLTMPITLWLLYKAMPDSPGFAFGLAASALWPGTIIGQLLTLTGPSLWMCVILCFTFGLFAIVYSAQKIKEE